jgi:hypothetical protein
MSMGTEDPRFDRLVRPSDLEGTQPPEVEAPLELVEQIATRDAQPRIACPGGPGHDDPDASGLCIRCGGTTDGLE